MSEVSEVSEAGERRKDTEQGSYNPLKTTRDGPGQTDPQGDFRFFLAKPRISVCFSNLGRNLLGITGFRPPFYSSRWSPEVLNPGYWKSPGTEGCEGKKRSEGKVKEGIKKTELFLHSKRHSMA